MYTLKHRLHLVCLGLFLWGSVPAISFGNPVQDTVSNAERDGYQGRPEDLKPGSLLGGTLAVMPGIVFHGLGHAYVKEYRTAIALFCAELVGLSLMIGSKYLNELTGGSQQSAAAEHGLSHLGFVLFMGSWAADMIGTYKGSAPFGQSRRATTRPHLGLTYRYTDNPLNRFRHHIEVRMELEVGRIHIRPSIDLEAELKRRSMGLELGTRLLGSSIVSDHLSIGARLSRWENEVDGWAAQTSMLYDDGRLDIGRFMPSLRRFYIFNRTGYGIAGYQLSSRANNVPAILSEVSLVDTWIYLESGGALSIGTGTDLSLALVQDPTGVVSPLKLSSTLMASTASEVVAMQLHHRYEDDAGIEVKLVLGQGFGIWLGLEYAL